MNKKKKEPVFLYPFKDKHEEEDKHMMEHVASEYISDKGTKVKLTQTYYSGGYRKLVLEETVYVKNSDTDKRLSDTLHLRPHNQVKTEKYFIIDIDKNPKGGILMTRENINEPIPFNINEMEVILYFHEKGNGSLLKATKDIQVYKNEKTLLDAINRINRRFKTGFCLSKNDNLISGKQREDYSFNEFVRFNFISDVRILGNYH